MVEWLTWDRGAAGSSLTGVAALCSWARHIYSSLVLVQPRKTRLYITERLLMGCKESNWSINKLATNIWKDTLIEKCFEDWSQSSTQTSILTYSDLLKSWKFGCSHLCPPMLSAVNLCKQFGPRSGPTKCRAWFGSKLWYHCKKMFVLKKKSADYKKACKIRSLSV